MQSSDLVYRVEEWKNGWTVAFCHERNGSFPRRIDAIRAAVLDADRVRHMGHRVTVSIARPGGSEAPLPARTMRVKA